VVLGASGTRTAWPCSYSHKITQLVRSPNPKTEHDIPLRLESGTAGETSFSV